MRGTSLTYTAGICSVTDTFGLNHITLDFAIFSFILPCVFHIVKNLRKFDHASAHCTELGWLPVDTLIRYRTLCTMHQLYHKTFNLLDPPIRFVPQHTYSIRCPL